ncbi:MAG TPA: hypothetical protein VHT53_13675 [Candidatus Elarobacter sp.]|nr:hypothetical protein [Candidatus Elarobacter sp.]
MKRLFVASALAASLIASSAELARASITRTGTAQIEWTASATATMAIVTQYSTTFTQGVAAPTLLPSIAGVCTAGASETGFTLTFGSLSPRSNAATACLYKNAIAVSVQTNDASGFSVHEYLDATPTTGVGICAYPNGGGGSFPEAPAIAPVTASARSGNPAAGTFTGNNLTSCGAGGTIVPPGAGGASTGGATPGNPGTGGLEYYAPSTANITLMSQAGPTVNGGALAAMYGAQDVQVNLAAGAPSTLAAQTGVYMTIELVPN